MTEKIIQQKSEIPVMRQGLARKFTCWAGNCYCTCCQNWEVVVDDNTREMYKKDVPEAFERLKIMQNNNGQPIHVIDHVSHNGVRQCPFFDKEGLCGIVKKYGEDCLCTLCYYFPNVHKKIGNKIYMPLAIPCPASAELALYSNDLSDFSWYPSTRPRVEDVSDAKKNFPGADTDKLINMFDAVMYLVNGESATPGEIIGKLLLFANDYDNIPYNKKLDYYLRSITIASKGTVNFVSSWQTLDYEDSLLHVISRLLARREGWTYINSLLSIVKNVFPNKGGILDSFDSRKTKELDDVIETYNKKMKIATPQQKNELNKKIDEAIRERNNIIKKTNDDLSGTICGNKNSRSFSELKKIWNVRKHEFDDIFKNYIRSALCRIVYPLGVTHLDTKCDIYLIAVHFAMLRFILICIIDKIKDVETDKDMIVKIFQGFERAVYTNEAKTEIQNYNGVINVYNTHFLLDLCCNYV
ncbi:MAG: flagellin lysine-N-methylase [Rickettsiales bacterium]|jgi:hypothetical protein|nr:flagellin lysine-N-methylase [Rickettsiales bacterium]